MRLCVYCCSVSLVTGLLVTGVYSGLWRQKLDWLMKFEFVLYLTISADAIRYKLSHTFFKVIFNP